MQHGHVGAAAALDVVPEDGGAALGRDGEAEPREGSVAAQGDLQRGREWGSLVDGLVRYWWLFCLVGFCFVS